MLVVFYVPDKHVVAVDQWLQMQDWYVWYITWSARQYTECKQKLMIDGMNHLLAQVSCISAMFICMCACVRKGMNLGVAIH